MSPLNLFFDKGLRNVLPPGTIATHGSLQDNPPAGTTYTNSFGSPVAVQPVPRIRRVRRSPKDFQDQPEGPEYRVPKASAADKVGPKRVDAGGRVGHCTYESRSGLSVPAPFVWRCLTSPTVRNLQHPLIEPDVRFARIRLSGHLHRRACVGEAQGARVGNR